MNIDQKLWNKLHGPMHYKINKRSLPITGILLYIFEIYFLSCFFVNVSAPISDLNRSNTCNTIFKRSCKLYKHVGPFNIIKYIYKYPTR